MRLGYHHNPANSHLSEGVNTVKIDLNDPQGYLDELTALTRKVNELSKAVQPKIDFEKLTQIDFEKLTDIRKE